MVTNGREWRLYDATVVTEDMRHRLVDAAVLDDEAALMRLLRALSKPSVTSGGLERYALRCRLHAVLREQLTADGSPILKVIRNQLKKTPGLSELQTRHVAAFFKELFCPPSATIGRPPATIETPSPDKPDKGAVVPPPPPAPRPDRPLTLRDLVEMGIGVTGKSPEQLFFPDGAAASVSTWRELPIAIVRWLGERGRLPPLPFRPGHRGTCFLSNEPREPGGTEMRHHRRVEFNGGAVYVNSHSNAFGWMRRLQALCQAVGEDPAGFRVTLRE